MVEDFKTGFMIRVGGELPQRWRPSGFAETSARSYHMSNVTSERKITFKN